MKQLKTEKAIKAQYKVQDFYPHVMGNGVVIMVSNDNRFYYKKQY